MAMLRKLFFALVFLGILGGLAVGWQAQPARAGHEIAAAAILRPQTGYFARGYVTLEQMDPNTIRVSLLVSNLGPVGRYRLEIFAGASRTMPCGDPNLAQPLFVGTVYPNRRAIVYAQRWIDGHTIDSILSSPM